MMTVKVAGTGKAFLKVKRDKQNNTEVSRIHNAPYPLTDIGFRSENPSSPFFQSKYNKIKKITLDLQLYGHKLLIKGDNKKIIIMGPDISG